MVNFGKFLTKYLLILGVSSASIFFSKIALSAQDIAFNYGILEFSVSIKSLEIYATTGKIESDLGLLVNFLTEKQLMDLQTILTVKADLTPVAVAQFFYSPQGETILERLGQIVQTPARQHGFYAIRSALILASAEPEGLTLLNILRKFPLPRIKINSAIGFDFMAQLGNLIENTQNTLTIIEKQFEENLSEETPLNFQLLPDLRRAGRLYFQKETITLNYLSFNKENDILVDLYLPDVEQETPFPLIIISHGLGSDRQTFAYLAQHFASYGWAVAVPEHRGSNSQQLQDLLMGANRDLITAGELIERPLEIKTLLNELEQNYGHKINLQQVGFFGQSLGAYTGLNLVGASLDFKGLAQQCPEVNQLLNLSLLLQCRVLEAPRLTVNLQDARIKAIIAVNPLTSLIFGQENLHKVTIPTLLVGGTSDPITPLITEQIIPFSWLGSKDKYLMILQKGTHFSSLAKVEGNVNFPEQTVGPDPAIAHEYLKAITLAFFNIYVRGEVQYNYYLTSGYAQYLNQDLMPLLLIKNDLVP